MWPWEHLALCSLAFRLTGRRVDAPALVAALRALGVGSGDGSRTEPTAR
jgi:hypothetical protein